MYTTSLTIFFLYCRRVLNTRVLTSVINKYFVLFLMISFSLRIRVFKIVYPPNDCGFLFMRYMYVSACVCMGSKVYREEDATISHSNNIVQIRRSFAQRDLHYTHISTALVFEKFAAPQIEIKCYEKKYTLFR